MSHHYIMAWRSVYIITSSQSPRRGAWPDRIRVGYNKPCVFYFRRKVSESQPIPSAQGRHVTGRLHFSCEEIFGGHFLRAELECRRSGRAGVFFTMSGSRDPNLLAQTISSNIQNITHHTSEIQRIVTQLGTDKDTTELRQRLKQKQQYVNQLAKETDKCMKEFTSLPVTADQRQRKIQRERLVGDFSNALAIFQKAQRQAAEKEKEFVARVRAGSRVSGGFADDAFGDGSHFESPPQPLSACLRSEVPAQTQSFEDGITEEDLHLIKERETAIRELESDITDINEIFKDLAVMVHEQGDMIDSIEANVESAEVNVQSATQQLSRAATYQPVTPPPLGMYKSLDVATSENWSGGPDLVDPSLAQFRGEFPVDWDLCVVLVCVDPTQQCCWRPQCHCWTENHPPTKAIQPAAACGAASCGAASLWGSVLWGSVPVGQRPVGQRPVGQRPVGQRPVGQRPVGQRPVPTDEGLEDDQHCTVQQQMSYRL
ncbi:hypothetical protein NFI96_001174 [Prochilodus magdalenae]|nr:hypothetical protein NFI96_001174 [Prochilodus magdalenae]